MVSKNDYDILGLPENADRKLVEAKYGALLRAYKQRTDEKGTTDEDMEYYKKITAAYDNIVGTVHDFSDPNPTSAIPFKIRNFFYKLSANLDHYKFIIMAVIMVAVIGILGYFQFRDTDKDDLRIKFVGAYYTLDTGKIEAEISEISDVTKAPQVSFFSVTVKTSMNDNAAVNESVQFRAQFLGGGIDIILIDRDNYDVYVDQYVFFDLSDFVKSHEDDGLLDRFELLEYKNKGEEDLVPDGIYGIEITEAAEKYFSSVEDFVWLNDTIEGKERSMIMTVCRKSENRDKALEYGLEILKSINSEE